MSYLAAEHAIRIRSKLEAGGAKPAETSARPFNVEAEVKAFYLHLLDSDVAFKKQFEALTADSRETNGGIFFAFEPHVVEWLPCESNWNVAEDSIATEDCLVIQPVGYPDVAGTPVMTQPSSQNFTSFTAIIWPLRSQEKSESETNLQQGHDYISWISAISNFSNRIRRSRTSYEERMI